MKIFKMFNPLVLVELFRRNCFPNVIIFVPLTVDNCPQRFDSGVNPYKLPNTIWVLNTAAGVRVSHWIYSLTLAVICLLVLR